jgi:hypothetical protein
MLCEVCKAKHWAEIIIGRSQAKFACLDAYVKVVSHGEAIGEDEAWYVLGASIPVALRNWFPRPELEDRIPSLKRPGLKSGCKIFKC